MSADLSGRRIVVTGASSGIGEATARACMMAGAAVAGVARRRERLSKLAAETGMVPIHADVADYADAERAVAEAARALGGLDAVINCAGVMHLGSIEQTDPETWSQMFKVNVFGVLHMTKAAIPLLRESGAADIVNVSSMAGKRVPDAMGGVYGASKAAVNFIGETLRRELHGTGIRVMTMLPGKVETELRDHISAEQLHRRARGRTPVAGLAAEAVGSVIVFALAAPPEVNQFEIAVLPTEQELD